MMARPAIDCERANPAGSRHPWPCFLFLLPLLLAYEGGVFWLGRSDGEPLRNGADAWLRWALQQVGIHALFLPPLVILFIFLIASWRRWGDRPRDVCGVWLRMALESVLFALVLWGIGNSQSPFWHKVGVAMTLPATSSSQLACIVTFVGAGIYEELLFRLLLFPGLRALFALFELPRAVGVGLAMVLSALTFAAAHHLGPYGEPIAVPVFLFRTLAGVYFALIFQFRGFGVVVGSHALYDILVGAAMEA